MQSRPFLSQVPTYYISGLNVYGVSKREDLDLRSGLVLFLSQVQNQATASLRRTRASSQTELGVRAA